MALSPTQETLCNSLDKQFDSAIAPIEAAKSAYQKKLREFKSGLQSIEWSPDIDIDSALDQLKSDVADNIPGDQLSDMEELQDMLDNCPFLAAFSPASAMISSIGGMFDKIADLLSSTAQSTPEFGLGKIANDLYNYLQGLGIPGGSVLKDLFDKADQIINCLANVCGRDVQDKIDTLENLRLDYELTNDFEIDYASIYSDANVSSTNQAKMDKTVEGVNGVQSDAKSAMGSAVDTVKSLSKTGGFF